MSHRSCRLAGILLLAFPTVVFGGVSVLSLLINDPAHRGHPLRQDLWRAGHAHAGSPAGAGAAGARQPRGSRRIHAESPGEGHLS